MTGLWEDRDVKNGNREKLARIVASIASGVHPGVAVPTDRDYALADEIREDIEAHVLRQVPVKNLRPLRGE